MRQPIFPTQNTSDGRNLRIELLRSAPEPKSCTLHGNTTKSNAYGHARPLPSHQTEYQMLLNCSYFGATSIQLCHGYPVFQSRSKSSKGKTRTGFSRICNLHTTPPFLVKCPMNPNFYQPLTKQDSAILGTNNFQHTLCVADSGSECLLHLLFL